VDVPRVRKPKRARWIALAAGLAVVGVVGVALARLRDAPPAVDAATVTEAIVVRGPLQREVRAQGRLVPLEIRFVTAETSGRVDKILLRAGAVVQTDTLLVELTNPDTLLAQLQTERELASAQGDLVQLDVRLKADELQQENTLWNLRQEASDVARRADAYQRGGSQIFTQLDIDQIRDRSEALRQRVAIAEKQLAVTKDGYEAQLGAQRKQIVQRQEMAEFRKKQVEAMRVRAGSDGVLEDMPLEVGQWVVPGTELAKVVKPEHLKALLRVPEVQAKDVAIGQAATIDTRNGLVPGHVARIATAASQGTVEVEVLLDADPPAGARPDLNVDAVLSIERLDDVLSVERPVGAQSEQPMTVFRVLDGGKEAVRVKVQIGRVSVKSVEVRSGLEAGWRVIVSDMSRWDSNERIALR
jgi:multidrug resistance efflux pump